MLDRLQALEDRYNKLNEMLSDPEVASDPTKLRDYGKEQSGLEEVVLAYREHKDLSSQLSDAKEMLEDELDEDMEEMVEAEIDELKEQITALEEKMKVLLLPKDPNDGKNVIMEIRGAAGGDEAALFAD